MLAYKLFRRRKDGTIGPLFINRRQRVPLGQWLEAEDHPTSGFAHRPGWHCGVEPRAPHLTRGAKSSRDREWFVVEVADFTTFRRPDDQGGEWVLANRMRVLGPLVQLEEVRRAA
jgi:hypothetical protein